MCDEKGDDFFFATQPLYKKYPSGKGYRDDFRLSRTAELRAEKVDERFFLPTSFRIFSLVFQYSAFQYTQLLRTYSPMIAMEEAQRDNFLRDMENLIEERFGGSIQKHVAITVTIARRR